MSILFIIMCIVLCSIIINIMIYKKFIYCEWLIIKDLISIIYFIILNILGCFLINIAIIYYSTIIWYRNTHLIKFIRSQILTKDELFKYEEKIKNDKINNLNLIKFIVDAKLKEKSNK